MLPVVRASIFHSPVRIYKCEAMVTNCGQCLTMGPDYECGWCTADEPQCSLQSECPASSWLDRSSTCPEPQIHRVSGYLRNNLAR